MSDEESDDTQEVIDESDEEIGIIEEDADSVEPGQPMEEQPASPIELFA